MKKNIIIILAAALTLLAVSCKKESAGVTRITYYPTITLKGDNPLVIKKGGSFTDPGFEAEMNGEDVASQVKVNASGVDTSTPGIYSVSYSMVNADGFTSTVTRDVYVTNPGGIDNVYVGECWMGSRHYNGFPIVISLYQDGVYLIDDLCGGFYCYGRYPGYEPTYDFHADTLFSLGADGSINVLQAGNWYFVSSFDYSNITGGYDASTGIFEYDFDGLGVKLVPLG